MFGGFILPNSRYLLCHLMAKANKHLYRREKEHLGTKGFIHLLPLRIGCWIVNNNNLLPLLHLLSLFPIKQDCNSSLSLRGRFSLYFMFCKCLFISDLIFIFVQVYAKSRIMGTCYHVIVCNGLFTLHLMIDKPTLTPL